MANVVLGFYNRFVRGPLPSDEQLLTGTEPQEVLRAAELRELYNEGEADEMLCALMQCRATAFLQPGATSLDQSQPTGPFDYEGGPLVLTELGRAVVAGEEDFSRHNPIHRWWGGTELTNERLWRWDPKARSLIAP